LRAFSSSPSAGDWTPQTLDIYFIVADDLGTRDFDTPRIATPNINALASEGMTFSRARSAVSICAPTRYTIETGEYSWRQKADAGDWTGAPVPLPAGKLTLAAMLKSKGYTAMTFGKWHATWKAWRRGRGAGGKDWSLPMIGGRMEASYDYYFGGTVSGTPGAFVENGYVTEEPTVQMTNFKGHQFWAVPGWSDRNFHPTVMDKLEEKVAQAGPEPIFVHFQPIMPHLPIVPEDAFVGTSEVSRYGDYIAQLDRYVGRIRDAIDARGRPAVIFFTSDSGSGGYSATGEPKGSTVTCCNHDPNGRLRDWKHSIYEGGVRIPLIVWWPGIVPAGASADQVLTTDYCRTLARIVGYDVPPDQCLDSFDFWPSAVPGLGRVGPRRTVSIVQDNEGNYALVDGKWKVLQQAHELYDLESNPGERASMNLWSEKVGLRNSLLSRLNDAKASAATYPDIRSTRVRQSSGPWRSQ
jgi:arylsulfatase A